MNVDATLAAARAALISGAFCAILAVVFRLGGHHGANMSEQQYKVFARGAVMKLLRSLIAASICVVLAFQINWHSASQAAMEDLDSRVPNGASHRPLRKEERRSAAEPSPQPTAAQDFPVDPSSATRQNQVTSANSAPETSSGRTPPLTLQIREFITQLEGIRGELHQARIRLVATSSDLREPVCELRKRLQSLGAVATCDVYPVPEAPKGQGVTVLYPGTFLSPACTALLIRMARLEIPVTVRESKSIRADEFVIVLHDGEVTGGMLPERR